MLFRTVPNHCELPDADLRYSTGFPIQWQQPPELCSSLGLTLPPRAGVLVPKTHTFSCNTYLLAWFSLTALVVKMSRFYHEHLLVSSSTPSLFHAALGIRLWGRIVNSGAFIPTLGYRQSAELLLL